MSLFNVFDISGSAMSAQSVRLNTVASNLANAQSVSSSADETYKARHPVFN
ncbi:MAG: flagellar basal body rod protein FlgC, partial [Plesiomonas sp.]